MKECPYFLYYGIQLGVPFSIQFKRRFTINNTAFGAENKKEQVNECRQYTVEDLFCCAYAPFFWQAIQMRYPEYATYNRELSALLRLFWAHMEGVSV